MIRGLHHVGIVTANLERTIGLYRSLFGSEPSAIVNIEKSGIKLRTAMLSLGNSYLQVIEPIIGPGVDALQRYGEGAILEIALEVKDIEQFHHELQLKGVDPVNIVGEAIEEKYLVASSGNRYFYLPKHATSGTSIEVYQVILGTQ